jgi:hypothetical protein
MADEVSTVILAKDVDKRRGTSKNVPFDQGGARFGPHVDRAKRQRTPSSTTGRRTSMNKQNRQPAWQKDVDDLIAASQHVGRLARELEEALARKGPAVRPERLVQIQKVLLLEKDFVTKKMLILADLAERAAEARRARAQRVRSPRRAPAAAT